MKLVGESLLKLLQKHVLPVRCYAAKLRVKQAEQLMVLCIRIVEQGELPASTVQIAAGCLRQLLQACDLIQEQLIKSPSRVDLDNLFLTQIATLMKTDSNDKLRFEVS